MTFSKKSDIIIIENQERKECKMKKYVDIERLKDKYAMAFTPGEHITITEKIDGAVALIMALDRAIRCGNDTGASVYDERDLLVL